MPDPIDPAAPDARPRRRADVAERAVAAAVAVAREHGLRVDEPVVLADLFSVQCHLAPAPVVAGVSTWTATIRPDNAADLARKVAVTEHLERCGAPVVPNSRELPPGPHTRDGFVVTFTEYAPPDPDRSPDVADCLAMLPDLHAALATFPGDLPLLGPPAVDIPIGLDALERHPDALDAADRDRLRAAVDRLGPYLADPGDTATVLHGDVHPGNLLATGGGLRWIDFEDVCRGPVGWDLALLRWMDPAAGDGWAGPEELGLASDLRATHLALCMLSFRDAFGDDPAWDGYVRDFVHLIST
jgi:hypothetical protein